MSISLPASLIHMQLLDIFSLFLDGFCFSADVVSAMHTGLCC